MSSLHTHMSECGSIAASCVTREGVGVCVASRSSSDSVCKYSSVASVHAVIGITNDVRTRDGARCSCQDGRLLPVLAPYAQPKGGQRVGLTIGTSSGREISSAVAKVALHIWLSPYRFGAGSLVGLAA